MMASIRFRHSLANLLIGALLAAPPAAAFARDPAPPFSMHAQKELEDNVATDASTATFNETVKWLTENLLKNGHCHYTKVVMIRGISTPLRTTETIVGADVKADVLELKIVSALSGDSPSKTQVTETLSLPLRLIKHVSTSDGDPSLPAALAARGQFTYVTLTIACGHNEIEDKASTYSTSDDSPPSTSDSTDILKELNIHIDQNYEYCQRLEKAIRHLAKLSRAMPASNAAEPF